MRFLSCSTGMMMMDWESSLAELAGRMLQESVAAVSGSFTGSSSGGGGGGGGSLGVENCPLLALLPDLLHTIVPLVPPAAEVRKAFSPFAMPFVHKMHHFTTTGSGQT
jgi:hypothetical protein